MRISLKFHVLNNIDRDKPCLHYSARGKPQRFSLRSVKEADCKHVPLVTGGGATSVDKIEFIWVNTMIGNIKNSMKGSYHSINSKHLPRYFAEFCYRFNRRFNLKDMMPRFLCVAMKTPPMNGKLLKMAELYV